MQIHIIDLDTHYYTEIIPIEYQELNDHFVIGVQNSPYLDIKHATNNSKLASKLFLVYKNSVSFKDMRKNDKIVIGYSQKIRLGEPFGEPVIHYAMVEVYQNRKKTLKHYIFKNPDDGRYYGQMGKSYEKFFFKVPLRYRRISSKFTYKRWHPVLHRYRAHLGVDYAAPRGRIIRASADGKIIYRGWKGGYGRVVEIKHKSGYKTLYAHMSKFSSRAKKGRRVKQGTIIGYVGSSGRSTGPHLHFGLYKNGRAINPQKRVKVTKSKLTGKKRRAFLKFVKKSKKDINYTIKKGSVAYKFETL
jgi:murein DD-endopeptidase MepM/ murein hydrolase activator NlpD